jgi:hypothetical protein
MPRAKTTAAVKAAPKNSADLMDFDQFVSQKVSSKSAKKSYNLLAYILVFIVLLLLGMMWWSMEKQSKVVKVLPYKVVYLDNNQYYYAKVAKEDANYIYLDDVYYLQTEQRTVPAEKEGDEPQVVEVPVLVHRGQEVHQPTGLLQISRDRVVAVEEIGTNSEVYKEIMKSKQQ